MQKLQYAICTLHTLGLAMSIGVAPLVDSSWTKMQLDKVEIGQLPILTKPQVTLGQEVGEAICNHSIGI